jgi:SagB-type dehydrogenase family enzyme
VQGKWLTANAVLVIGILVILVSSIGITQEASAMDAIKLPEARKDAGVSVEQALVKRRSTREFRSGPLSLPQVSQLLWAAQGITSPKGYRTAPSAGALYPLELYLVAGDVEELPAGIYRYVPRHHQLLAVIAGDKRASLAAAALGQEWIREGAAVAVFAAVYDRTTVKYGERGIRYVHIEVGHAAQNVALQAAAMGIGAVTVGAFDDDEVKKLLKLEVFEYPLYLMPLGRLAAP